MPAPPGQAPDSLGGSTSPGTLPAAPSVIAPGGAIAPGVVAPQAVVAGKEFACAGPTVASPTFVRRLTEREYSNTVRDVLGVEVAERVAQEWPKDETGTDFSNRADSLVVTLQHAEAFSRIADTVVGALPAGLESFAPCQDTTAACGDTLVQALSRRLFRAPALAEETASLTAVFRAAVDEDATFEEASQWVLRAMLQSPRFLYRFEQEVGDGNARPLSGYELASRLSYATWASAPDEALLAAAESGELATAAGLSSQLNRLLSDEKAGLNAEAFLVDWLGLGPLSSIQRSEERFPDFDAALLSDMGEETRSLMRRAYTEGWPLSQLFNAQSTEVSPALAAHYGFDGPPQADGSYDLSGQPERTGMITHGSVLALGGDGASMVFRGLYMLEKFFCQHLDSPPPGTDTTVPPLAAGVPQRSHSEQRVANPACGGCHSQIEPIAWGLARYDATGLYREQDEFGNALDDSGTLPNTAGPDAVFTGAAELGEALASHERVSECMQLQLSRFVMGRALTSADSCSLAQARSSLTNNAGSFQEIVSAIAASPMFQQLQTESE